MFTNGSVRRGVKSGWAYSARQNGVIEGSGSFAQTTSSMCMELRAISVTIAWLSNERYVQAIFMTDSMCTLERVCLGMHYADRKPAITAS